MTEKTAPQIRHEQKYYISYNEYLVLRDRLNAAMPLDNNAHKEKRTYHIRSLYFDDIYNTAMWEKMDGVHTRKKWRIRIYNFSDKQISLEKKGKHDKFTTKQATPLSRFQVDQMIRHRDYSFLISSRNPLMEEMYADVKTRLLRPIVVVDYTREPYIFPAGNVRITFDMNLHTGNFSNDIFRKTMMPIPVLEPDEMIMEIKYSSFLAPHLRDILNTTTGLRSAISKYALCRRFH
ncbi:MAG: polyphosphate polymerase domain-containing protein [Clostridiales bacterium]|nr:polyphosphate polymerase domain-containing protein [Clostridiales bacterium]